MKNLYSLVALATCQCLVATCVIGYSILYKIAQRKSNSVRFCWTQFDPGNAMCPTWQHLRGAQCLSIPLP